MHPNEIRLVTRAPDGSFTETGPLAAVLATLPPSVASLRHQSPYYKALMDQKERQIRLLEQGWTDVG